KRRQFVLANLPEQDLLLTGVRIEPPGAIFPGQRDGEWPILGPNAQHQRSVGLVSQAVHLLVFLDEQFAVELILAFVRRGGELARPSQDLCDSRLIVVPHSVEKSLSGFRRRGERRL